MDQKEPGEDVPMNEVLETPNILRAIIESRHDAIIRENGKPEIMYAGSSPS